MQVGKRAGNLRGVELSHILGEALLLAEAVEQFTAHRVLHHDIHGGLVLCPVWSKTGTDIHVNLGLIEKCILLLAYGTNVTAINTFSMSSYILAAQGCLTW